MSQDQVYWGPEQPPPQPSRGGSGLLLGIAIGCGGVMVLGCAGVMLIGFFAQRWFKESMSQDPAVVREVTAQMADIDVPQGLAPSASFTPHLPFAKEKGPLPHFVIYADQPSNSMLMLTSLGKGAANPQVQAQMRQQMDAALQQQGNASDRDMKVEESHTKDIKIGDQTAVFTFNKGRSTKGQQNRITVQGTFQGKTDPVMLMFFGDADKYDEATLVKMIESIKVK